MSARDGAPRPEADVLTLQIGGTATEPERLLVLARPGGGRVRVREWTSGAWHAEPVEREVDAAVLYDEVARAVDARRPVSVELYRLRRWLDGGAA